MKKTIAILFILIAIFTTQCYALDTGLYDHATHWVNSGETVTVAFESATINVTEFEVEAIHLETNVTTMLGKTPASQGSTFSFSSITFQLPRMGHYIFRVRAINVVGESIWSISTDSSVSRVNNEPRSWWVYGQLPPVTGIIIE